MSVDAWQKRLEKHFTENGVIGGQLCDVINCENNFTQEVLSNFRGYGIITDSFISFLVLTFKQFLKNQRKFPGLDYRCSAFFNYIAFFRRLRGAEKLLYLGYPNEGFVLLREIKDRAIIHSGIQLGFTSYEKIYGLDIFKEETIRSDQEKIKEQAKRIKKEELSFFQTIYKKMGFKDSEIQEICQWNSFFNREVHGQKITMAQEIMEWMKLGGIIPIFPTFKKENCSMYLNRSNEVCWMFLRILPLLQTEIFKFDKNWIEKWYVLDESFKACSIGLGEIGRPIGYFLAEAIPRLIPFTPKDYWKE